MKKYPHILSEIARTPWAITPSALKAIVGAANGRLDVSDYPIFHQAEKGKQEIVRGQLGEKVEESYYSFIKGSLGVMQLNGPIVPRADLFTDISGLASIDRLSVEFRKFENDPKISKILFVIDSPGGAITGISEFASQVKAATKPTAAYIYGVGASAAYWIASAVDQIYVGDTSRVGSIGCVMSVWKGDEDDVEIVSSQSPNKRPDPDTEEGLSELQATVDGLAEVFVNTVAENRGVTHENVLADFGRGGIVLSQQAQRVGMVDGQATLENFLKEFSEMSIEACWWFRKKKKKGASAMNEFDIHLKNGENKSKAQALVKRSEEKKMTLKEFLKENPDAASELEAIKAQVRSEGMAEGREKAMTEMKERSAFATKILESAEYPAKIKTIAASVIAGTKNADYLELAVTLHDSLKAEKEMSETMADGEKIPNTPPQRVETKSTDGILRTSADIDAEAERLKAGR
jgi:ClpP class serine protease